MTDTGGEPIAAILDPIARICLAALFVSSGLSKFADLGAVAGAIAGKGIPFPTLLAQIAAASEVAGGIALAVGLRARVAAAVLLAYTLLVTRLFRGQQYMAFMNNLWAVGGLLLVLPFGAPAFSLDDLLDRRGSEGSPGSITTHRQA